MKNIRLLDRKGKILGRILGPLVILLVLFSSVGINASIVHASYSIPGNTTIGTWDPVTRTFTMTKDVSQTIIIGETNLTLDGNDFMISVVGPGNNGVKVFNKDDITLRNLDIKSEYFGIWARDLDNLVITDSAVSADYPLVVESSTFADYNSGHRYTGNTFSGDFPDGYSDIRCIDNSLIEDNVFASKK